MSLYYCYNETYGDYTVNGLLNLKITLHELSGKTKLDLPKTIEKYGYSLVTKDGECKDFYTWYNLLCSAKDILGLDFDLDKCRVYGSTIKTYVLYLKEEPKEVSSITVKELDHEKEELASEELTSYLENTPSDDESSDIADNADHTGDDELTDSDDTEAEEASQEESVNIPDFEYANSLYDEKDKSGSKLKLEAYGKEFGVDLNRGKKFEDMIEEFKSLVG